MCIPFYRNSTRIQVLTRKRWSPSYCLQTCTEFDRRRFEHSNGVIIFQRRYSKRCIFRTKCGNIAGNPLIMYVVNRVGTTVIKGMREIEDRQGKETRSDERGNAFACQNLVEALEPRTRNAWHFILKSFLPCQPDIPDPRISSPLFSNVPTNIYRTDSTFLYLPIAAMYLTEQKWRLTRTIDQIDSNEAIRQSFRDLAYYFPLRWPAFVPLVGLFIYNLRKSRVIRIFRVYIALLHAFFYFLN